MIKKVAQRMVCLIPGGLSVTNAALIAKTAASSHSRVMVECKNKIYVGHNICGLLSMGINHGDLVAVDACGEDAEETVRNIGLLMHEDIEDVFNPMHSDNFQTALA